ncbi:MAG: glutaredoxin family protein, partial [Psychromonas sp.]|nr:glutaredoxin family protein [Psychromonas sp.]
MTSSLRLYYTDGCHLCDDAMVLLEQLNLTYQKIDIVDDP